MKFKELSFVVCLVGGMLISPLIFGLKWMTLTVLTFFIIFGFYEWLAVKKTKKTISQHFWYFKENHPVKGWILIVGWGVAWAALLWHFANG